MKTFQLLSTIALASALMTSCTKYQEIGEASFSDQLIYMPTAVEGNAVAGIYSVNRVATPGTIFRYTADVAGKRLNIPLSVYRSGATTKGAINVAVAANADTATKVLAAGRFPAGTELLPANRYTLPGSVTITDGADYAPINLSVDLDFLLANSLKKFAIGVGVSSTERKSGQFSTTVLLLDASFLVPNAMFTTVVSGRTASFSNTSLNANAYTWDYGDGTPLSTAPALPHTYAAAGTYTVKLIAAGALGDFNKSTLTTTVVIP